MTLLTALFSQLKDAPARRLIALGFMPAALGLLLWMLATEHMAMVAAVLEPDAKTISDRVAAIVLTWVGAALVLVGGRILILRFFQAPPLLGPLLRISLRFTLARAYRLRHATERLEAQCHAFAVLLSSASGPKPGFPTTGVVFPHWMQQAKPIDLDRGLTDLELILANPRTPDLAVRILSDAEVQTIAFAVCQSHFVASQGTPSTTSLLDRWNRILARPDSLVVIRQAYSALYRELQGLLNARVGLPSEDTWIAPTRFANRIAALDDYGEQVYGMDTTTLWSRLEPLVPDARRDAVTGCMLQVHACMNSGFAIGIAASIVLTQAIIKATDSSCVQWWPISIGLGGLLVSYFAYRAGVLSFDATAEQIQTAIDLYRRLLIEQLGFAPRVVPQQERALFEAVTGQIRSRNPLPPEMTYDGLKVTPPLPLPPAP